MYIIEDILMKVAKWGNSLAVRLPKEEVERLGLKENDEVRFVHSADKRTLIIEREMTREEALAELRKMRGWLPADYKFNRDEIYERDNDK
jgi:antitoxin MazE